MLKTTSSKNSSTSPPLILVEYDRLDDGDDGSGKLVKKLLKVEKPQKQWLKLSDL